MPDIFSLSADFYEHFPSPILLTKKRKILLAEVKRILLDALFFSPKKRENMKMLLPFFSTKVLEGLKNTLIRQNLRYLIQKQ